MAEHSVTGRLAPSPTGSLHLGHAFAFLAAWWSARGRGGRVILRLEDVDADRAGQVHIDGVLEDLRWLGLDWDGEPIVQSRRAGRLRLSAEELAEQGFAYPCVCTRGDLARARSREERAGAPQSAGEIAYPGTCRGRFGNVASAEEISGRQAGLRFIVPAGDVSFTDAVFGSIEADVAKQVGDFLILRRNKTPAYQLAVVLDDAEDGVTEVIRGRDLLDSTCRQLLLARALGLPSPRYAHLPLICDHSGRRLAKRDEARGLRELRSAGVRPQAIVRWAARSLGQGRVEGTLTDIARQFRLSAIPRDDIFLPPDLEQLLTS